VIRTFARFLFSHESLSRRLERSRWAQAMARRLRAREWINAALARVPIRRRLPGSGVKYNVETFETLAVERAYFGNPVYAQIFAANPPMTFIDLGCNAGIFPCLLAHFAGGRAPRGLCVDANAAQVELAKKNAALNGWSDVHVRCGLVGRGRDGEGDFFLHPTSLGSSRFAYPDSESGFAPEWKRITVPSIEIADIWTLLFGSGLRCACLKIDIEGSEKEFLQQETAFLSRVDAILLEWHTWTTTRAEITNFLERASFRLDHVIEDQKRHGVLFFRRR
jgi:FkbM family methyltransferase